MTVLRVRGFALPQGEPVDLYADGDRWTTEPVARAELVAEGWLVSGLVDAHTHPGAKEPGDPLDESVLRDDLHQHVAAGVTMIRSPGLAGDPPSWFGRDEDVPRAVHSGMWIAQHGQFFDGWGRRVDLAELPEVAAEQAGQTGWVKLIADWLPGDDVMPASVLRAVVEAVHAWSARSYLGLGGLEVGAPADAVIYDADPRSDLTQLDTPRAVVLRGRLRYVSRLGAFG